MRRGDFRGPVSGLVLHQSVELLPDHRSASAAKSVDMWQRPNVGFIQNAQNPVVRRIDAV